MEVGTKTFAEFVEDRKTRFGMVITGAGEPYEEWLDGISALLYQEGIVKPVGESNLEIAKDSYTIPSPQQCFDLAYVLTDNVKGPLGRTDLVLFFNKDANPDVGKLAIWRLKFGSCMWTDDFVDNHHNEFKSGHREYVTDDYVEEEA